MVLQFNLTLSSLNIFKKIFFSFVMIKFIHIINVFKLEKNGDVLLQTNKIIF